MPDYSDRADLVSFDTATRRHHRASRAHDPRRVRESQRDPSAARDFGAVRGRRRRVPGEARRAAEAPSRVADRRRSARRFRVPAGLALGRDLLRQRAESSAQHRWVFRCSSPGYRPRCRSCGRRSCRPRVGPGRSCRLLRTGGARPRPSRSGRRRRRVRAGAVGGAVGSHREPG